jgi:hypothetical protein
LELARTELADLRHGLDTWSSRQSIVADRQVQSDSQWRAAVAEGRDLVAGLERRLSELSPRLDAALAAAEAWRHERPAALPDTAERWGEFDRRLASVTETLDRQQRARDDDQGRAQLYEQRLAELAARLEQIWDVRPSSPPPETHWPEAQQRMERMETELRSQQAQQQHRHEASERRLSELDQRAEQIERRLDHTIAQHHVLDASRHAEEQRGLTDSRHPLEHRLAGLRAEREAREDVERQERAERALARLVEPLRSAPTKGSASDTEPHEPKSLRSSQPHPPQVDLPQAEPSSSAATADEQAGAPAATPRSTRDSHPTGKRPSEPAPVEFQATRTGAPTSTQELFAKMGLRVASEETLRGPEAHSGPPLRRSEPESPAARDAERLSRASAPAAERPAVLSREGGHGPAEGGEDESIEQYMARLMARVRNVEPAREPSLAQPAAPAPEAVRVDESEAAEPAVVPTRRPAERIKPPELFTDLNALRDLANLNARTAIDTHSRRRLTQSMRGKLLLSVVALGMALALVLQSNSNPLLLYIGLAISLSVAAVWGGQWLLLARKLARHGMTAAEEPSPETAPVEAVAPTEASVAETPPPAESDAEPASETSAAP